MEYTDKEYCLEVWGDWACFTRPELKVERVSYDVITPSAARAIFEAILFKRYAMKWQVTRIEVINPIKWANIRRNEVGAVAGKSPIFIEDKRQQKNSLILQDVRYRIYAKLIFIPVNKRPPEAFAKHKADASENPMKYYEMFERRASNGQCFTQPYLGCREFAANWKYIFSHNMFVNITGVYTHNRSRFDYLSEERLGYIEGTKGGIVKEQNNHSTINDFGYRMGFDYRPNSWNHIRFGSNYIRHLFVPQNYYSKYDNTSQDELTENVDSRYKSNEFTLYAEDEMTLCSIVQR